MSSIWSHDCTIANSDGSTNKLGFMLWRGRNGRRSLAIQDAQTIAPRILGMGEYTSAEMPPELQYTWTQEDWIGGLGGIIDRLHPKTLAYGKEIDSSYSNKLRLAPVKTTPTLDNAADVKKPTGFITYSSDEAWAFIGYYPYQWDWTAKTWDRKTNFSAAAKDGIIGRSPVLYKGVAYVCRWTASADTVSTTSNYYWYKNTAGDTWTELVHAKALIKYLLNADGKLWGGYIGTNKHHLSSTTDGTAGANWATATAIGTSDSEITALVNYQDIALVCKEDGLYTADASGAVSKLFDFTEQRHLNNFRGAFSWAAGERVILPLGAGGMWELYQGVIRDISFKVTAPDLAWLDGRVLAGASTTTAIYILVQDPAYAHVHLVRGELVNIGGITEYRWSHVGQTVISAATVEEHAAVFVESQASGANNHSRVWFGIEDASASASVGFTPVFVPLSSGDAEWAYTSGSTPEAVTVKWDANLPHVNKRFASVDFTCGSFEAGATDHTIVVKYRVDGGNWTSLGTLTTSPQTLTFAAGITGKEIELQFGPVRGTTATSTPELQRFVLKAQVRPSAIKLLFLPLYIADGLTLRNGAREFNTKGLVAQLKTWDNQAAEVKVVLNDGSNPAGTTYTCVFLPSQLRFEETEARHGERPGYVARCTLAEV